MNFAKVLLLTTLTLQSVLGYPAPPPPKGLARGPYSQAQVDALRDAWKGSTKRNNKCSWLKHTDSLYMECMNGERCLAGSSYYGDWNCCNHRGGRARCPSSHPQMCEDKTCAGGQYCCAKTCSSHVRKCDLLDAGCYSNINRWDGFCNGCIRERWGSNWCGASYCDGNRPKCRPHGECSNGCDSSTHIVRTASNAVTQCDPFTDGVCPKNHPACCEAKTCADKCDSSHYPRLTQRPESCNGQCGNNDGNCCDNKHCSCTGGFTLKVDPRPEDCDGDGDCATNDSACCEMKTCHEKCGAGYAQKSNQRPASCNGQCAANDSQCCERKTCANKCGGGYVASQHQHPDNCAGQCTANDSNCCEAATFLIQQGTKQEDLEISNQFKMSFDLTPHDVRGEKSNILYVKDKALSTTPQADQDAVLAVYFKPGTTRLQACGLCQGTYECIDAPTALTEDQKYSIVVNLDFDARGPNSDSFSVNIDGTEVVSIACLNTNQPRQGELWVSHTGYDAAFAKIENTQYTTRALIGWQEPESGMSCTSHRLFVGNGISRADCQAKCEANALCHSIFFTETGLRSCTLCSTYHPSAAVKLADEYEDDLATYKMMQYKRDHLSDVQWYADPMYLCDDAAFAPGLASLTKDECEALAQTVEQPVPLPDARQGSGFVPRGCVMDRNGNFKWSDLDSTDSPWIFDIWDDLLVCKFEPEKDGLVQFDNVGRAWDANPMTATNSTPIVENQIVTNYIEMDLASPAQLMRVWIAQGWDDHIALKHMVDYEGTVVNVTVYNGHDYLPCKMNAKLSTRKQWNGIVCDYAQYAEKIRVQSYSNFRIAEMRVQGVLPKATVSAHHSDYNWTSAIHDGYYKVDGHRGCFGGEAERLPHNDPILARYKQDLSCRSTDPTVCLALARSECDSDWQRCWGFGILVVPQRGAYIEYYDVRAMNPDECAGEFGLRASDTFATYRRRTIQMQDVMVIQGSNFKYNWFTGEATVGQSMFKRQQVFMVRTTTLLSRMRDCTLKGTLEDTRMCYREMAFMESVGEQMAGLFYSRKAQTEQCHQNGGIRRLGASGLNSTSGVVVVPDVDEEFKISPQRDFIMARIEAGATGRRLGQQMEKADRRSTRVEDFEVGAAPTLVVSSPKPTRRLSTSESCWTRAKMLDTQACDNLQAASAMTLENMKISHSIAVDNADLIIADAKKGAGSGFGGFLSGLLGGAAAGFDGGPIGMALGMASGFVGGFTDLFTGMADGILGDNQADLAKREAHVIMKEMGAHEMQALSDKVQVCDMVSTEDLKCQLGDMAELQQQGLTNQANILAGMQAGFNNMGKEFKNVMRALGDNHEEILREFLRVDTILEEHSDTLYDITDTLNVLVDNVKNIESLIFKQHKINAIGTVRDWFVAWKDDTQRHNKFDKNLLTWCSKFVDELGDPNVIDYIADFSITGAFFQLTKPDSCTPTEFLRSYNKNYNSFTDLYEFSAAMSMYSSGFTQAQETSVQMGRKRMAEKYADRVKILLDATSCTDLAVLAELPQDPSSILS